MNGWRAILAAAGLMVSVAIGAPFTDPTRPPAASEAAVPAGSEAGPRVESILIAPDRRVAVINGETVTLGGRIADAEVVRINESEVVVRGAEGERTLKLLPDFIERVPMTQRGRHNEQ